MQTGTPFQLLKRRDIRQAAQHGHRYSRVVAVLRRVLAVVVGLVLIGLVAWPFLNQYNIGDSLSGMLPKVAVDNLRLSGTDKENRQYLLTADKALQTTTPDGGNLIDLEKLRGDITMTDGSWMAGVANNGRYDRTGKKLWLGGDVQLFREDGLTFTTREAQVDMERTLAWGETDVSITWPAGHITGEGFRVLDGGKVIVITGKTKAILYSVPSSENDKMDAQ